MGSHFDQAHSDNIMITYRSRGDLNTRPLLGHLVTNDAPSLFLAFKEKAFAKNKGE